MILVALAVPGCAPISAPSRVGTPDAAIDRWWRDLAPYEAELQRFIADARQLHEEYLGLRAEPSYPAVEEKVRDLAARQRAGDPTDAREIIVRSLYTLSLGELAVFQRLLALSTRAVTLEATRSELDAQRMELRLRRFLLERESAEGAVALQPVGVPGADASLIDQPVMLPLACEQYPVGALVLASCR